MTEEFRVNGDSLALRPAELSFARIIDRPTWLVELQSAPSARDVGARRSSQDEAADDGVPHSLPNLHLTSEPVMCDARVGWACASGRSVVDGLQAPQGRPNGARPA